MAKDAANAYFIKHMGAKIRGYELLFVSQTIAYFYACLRWLDPTLGIEFHCLGIYFFCVLYIMYLAAKKININVVTPNNCLKKVAVLKIYWNCAQPTINLVLKFA